NSSPCTANERTELMEKRATSAGWHVSPLRRFSLPLSATSATGPSAAAVRKKSNRARGSATSGSYVPGGSRDVSSPEPDQATTFTHGSSSSSQTTIARGAPTISAALCSSSA